MPVWCITHIATALLGAIVAWQWASYFHEIALNAEINKERLACSEAQKITQEVSNDLQKRLKTIDAGYADYISRLLRHEADKSSAPSGHDAATGSDGVRPSAGDILRLGAIAEKQTSQLIACQDFIRRSQ